MERKNRAIPKDSGLTQRLFSWSLEDIYNEDLYKTQVEEIPESFGTVDHYFGSYIYPLLEDIRAEMCSSMEDIHRAPFAEVISFVESKSDRPLFYDVMVDRWRNRFSDRDKEPYKTMPGDILILAEAKPETVSDLQRVGRTWTFALVTKIPEEEDEDEDEDEDDSTSTYFEVKISKNHEVDDAKQSSMFVVFLINTIANRRIWNALHLFGNMCIISRVLSSDSLVKENYYQCPVWIDGGYAKKFALSLSSNLNESQNQAVLACLRKIQYNHKPSVELIWGPPGTGKTKTVGVLLYTLLRMNIRTLACAPTNIAITEVVSRVLKLREEPFENDLGANSMFCSLGDILLFGNKSRLKAHSDIVEVYLDYRVDRLFECLGPVTGWRHRFNSMIDFLEDCVSHYRIFLENESRKEKSCSNKGGSTKEEVFMKNELSSNECESTKKVDISFIEFARDRFRATAGPLRRCVRIFCTHLPKSFILKQNFQNMVYLIQLLDSFESLLSKDDVVPEELERLFSHQEAVRDSYSDSSDLLYVHRGECLSVLKTLRSSLNELNLPSAMNKGLIKQFCFKMASLIFCTASSSYQLYRVNMKPLDLLVIDEAAQLKECESVIPLQLPDIRHAILIGDECQLPAMVSSKVSKEAGFGRSLFERLSSLGHFKHLLNVQYRMHPSISFFPNSKFYFNQILDAPNVKSKSYTKHYLSGPMFGSYSFINVRGKEEHDDVGKSRKNMIEVAIVIKIVGNLYKEWSGSNQKLSIGVISPYAAQVVAVQDNLGEKYENLDNFAVKVKTVDGFQAGEEDIIIMSTVRANSHGSIGFLSNPQRTNVALTRARHCLWILGNERTLAKSESVWEDLVCDAKRRKRFFNADEDKDMAKAILEIKTEFDQLDRLLDGSSILFKNARWKVLFSNNFRKSFVKLRSDRTKKSVMKLLLNLSSGWRPKRLNIDRVCESSSQILKQFKVEGFYIVCSIDIVKNTQVLRVWDILPLEDILKLVKHLDNIFQRYTDDFINRCKEKCLDGNLEVPRTWATSSDIVQFKNFCEEESQGNESADAFDGRSYVENSKVSESLLLMKFYSLSTGMVRHLLSDHDGRELDLPFEVTDQEQDIILYYRSTFILGRSGTGKTTVLTMKLFQKEQQHHIAMEGFQEDKGNASTNATYRNEVGTSVGKTQVAVLRQLFVTVSPKLCHAVKQHVSHLKSFAHGKKFSAESNSNNIDYVDDAELFNDIQDSLIDIPPKSYPLVVTFHKFLMMLDGTLGNSYFERFRDVWEFYRGKRSLSSIGMQTFIRTKEVTYDRFSSSYWPHFNSLLTKKLDSSRVFTEIISHIKGGLKGGRVSDSMLSREDYVLLSEARVSTLSGPKREIIYDIFQDYEQMKMEKGEFDLADLVIDLHCRLRHERYMGDVMDFVYIDEVQDLTMRQIALFKYICRNVNEGFVFSGDTAQTIARGIDFRFQDIRSLFYNEFVMESSDGRKEKGQVSEIFHLSQNFRTHAGVLKLSQSVIELLYRFFPQSVDILSPETSLIYGEAPVLLKPGKDENAIITMFGNSQNVGGNRFGFGAEQVILVRDDCARKEISGYIGKQALVLTILECKGLEFQDVLLYNFFGSSPLKNHWRVIYEYMKEQDLLDSTAPSPSFSQAKHNLLCSELKQLYVAITRTRQRLWICENTDELSKPMFDYWKKLCCVQVTQLDESLANAMLVASTPDEWKAMGMKLLREHHYEMATRCFERAEDTYWARLAKAHGLKAAAEQKRDLNPDAAHVDLRKAAEIFEEIGQAHPAAKCYFELNEYERAGRIYLEKCGESDLEKAGECFSLAGLHERAAEVYARGHFVSECLSACTKGKFFDLGLRYIQYWKQHATTSNVMTKRSKETEKIEQKFLESCAHHYHALKDNRTMMEFVKAFHSMESKCKFLTTLDCLDELLRLEEELGNFLEAANIAKLSGEILLEAEMLGKAGNYRDASILFLCYVLSNSLWASGSRGWPLKQFVKKEELLTKAKLFAERESKYFYDFVCMEASILSDEQTSLFEMNQCLSTSLRHKSVRGEILSARKIIDAHLNSDVTKFEWTDEWVYDLKQHSEVRLSQNCISVETLLYSWNVWKENIVNVLEFLGLDETQDVKDYASYGEFCLNYLGVRKQSKNLNVIYALLNPDADWVREVDDRFIRRTGRLVYVDGHQFASAAQSYWSSELFSIGTKVLENLKVLYNHSTGKSLSLFCQSKSLIHMFEVAKFLLKLKFLDRRCHAARTLQKFLNILTEQFCSKVFPLDWKKSSTENMVSLRETELSRILFKKAISTSISMKNELTHGQIGRVASWILGTGKQTTELYEKIAERFAVNPPWKAFINNLSGNKGSGFPQGSVPIHESQKHVSLVSRLDEALRDTYNANWRQSDYISPGYFLYLVDRLLILVTSSQEYCFTTKSSYIEWLIFQEWNSSPNPGFVANQPFPFGETLDYVARITQELLYNKHDTVEWIRKSNINLEEYYPLLLLRLVIIICLLCVNVSVDDGKYVGILFHLLEMSDITSQLPQDFCDVLRRRRKRNQFSIDISVFAKAFRKVDDPLVIVKLQRDSSEVSCPDAIFIDMTVNQSRQDLLHVLFQRSINSSSTKLPSNSSAASNLSSGVGWALKSQNDEVIGGNPENNYEHFWDFLDALDRSPMKNFLPNVPRVKLEVENNIRLITSVLAAFHKNPAEGEDVNLCWELNFMIDELMQLSSTLNVRNNSSRIRELVLRLKSRKPRVEPLLNRLFLQKDSTAVSEASSATTIPSGMQNQVDKGKGEAEESEEDDGVNTKTPSNSNNGETESKEGKGKRKAKKGRKGKGGRK